MILRDPGDLIDHVAAHEIDLCCNIRAGTVSLNSFAPYLYLVQFSVKRNYPKGSKDVSIIYQRYRVLNLYLLHLSPAFVILRASLSHRDGKH